LLNIRIAGIKLFDGMVVGDGFIVFLVIGVDLCSFEVGLDVLGVLLGGCVEVGQGIDGFVESNESLGSVIVKNCV